MYCCQHCRLALSKLGIKKGARKRLRKGQGGHLPFAWGVLGEGGDFDQVRLLDQLCSTFSATAAGRNGGQRMLCNSPRARMLVPAPQDFPHHQLRMQVPCQATCFLRLLMALQVQHVGQISRADYLAGLQDELA